MLYLLEFTNSARTGNRQQTSNFERINSNLIKHQLNQIKPLI